MTKRELEAEVERLRTELMIVRAQQAGHVCLPSAPACTCANGQMTTARCPVHQPYLTTTWINTAGAAGAAAGMPQAFIVDTTGANAPLTFTRDFTAGCAAGVPQVFTFNVPA